MSTMRELGMDAPSSDLELSCTEIQAEQRVRSLISAVLLVE